MKLQKNETLLVVIDVQQKLMPVIDDSESISRNIERLVRGCHVLDVPAILTAQYVKGLGTTIDLVRQAFIDTNQYTPIEKSCFSSLGSSEFSSALRTLKKKHILVSGVETHVCVYQTVIDLLAAGYEVTVIADAVSSRTARNREIALQRMSAEGARISSTEMALFELTVTSGTDVFRSISKLIR